MPTTWAELLELGDRDPVAGDAAPAEADQPPARRGFFRRLRESISTSREALSAEISSSLFETLDTEAWERLEEALIMADVRSKIYSSIIEMWKTGASGSDARHSALVRQAVQLLRESGDGSADEDHDEKIADIARQLGYGKSRLYDLFGREVGMAPNDYRQRVRIKRCCQRLVQTDESITSIGISDSRTLDGRKVDEWLNYLMQSQGQDIFRMKGVLNLKDEDRRYVFHGVHMMFDGKMERLWGAAPRLNSLVFIGRKLDRQEIEAGFESCVA